MPSGVEYVRALCKENKIPVSTLERECGFSNGYLNPKKACKIPFDRALAIVEYMKSKDITVEPQKILDTRGRNISVDYTILLPDSTPITIETHPNTLAPHFEGEEFSESEIEEILNFVAFVKGKRK